MKHSTWTAASDMPLRRSSFSPRRSAGPTTNTTRSPTQTTTTATTTPTTTPTTTRQLERARPLLQARFPRRGKHFEAPRKGQRAQEAEKSLGWQQGSLREPEPSALPARPGFPGGAFTTERHETLRAEKCLSHFIRVPTGSRSRRPTGVCSQWQTSRCLSTTIAAAP